MQAERTLPVAHDEDRLTRSGARRRQRLITAQSLLVAITSVLCFSFILSESNRAFVVAGPTPNSVQSETKRNEGSHNSHFEPPCLDKLKPEDQTDFSNAARGQVVWYKCEDDVLSPPPLVCGRMKAPLNYADRHDSRNASIAMVYYPAGAGKTNRKEVQGTLLLNPGGPGESGIGMLTKDDPSTDLGAVSFDAVMHGKYDLLGFDPRGVGATRPFIGCWKSDADAALFGIQSTTLVGNIDDASEIIYTQSNFELQAKLCATNPDTAEALKFVGTTAVVRDMRLIHKFFGDERLNYWGFSYGSVIGSTFADMFPNHVRRLAIDGVVNPFKFRLNSNLDEVEADATFDGFFKECVKAGAKICPLASHSQHPEKLRAMFIDLLHSLRKQPWSVIDADYPQLLTASNLLQYITLGMYFTQRWPEIAEVMDQLFRKNGTSFINATGSRLTVTPDPGYAVFAILCGDIIEEASGVPWTVPQVRSLYTELRKTSRLFMRTFTPLCLGPWKARSTERYYGEYTSNTSFPLLIVGNQHDPATPLVGAKLMASKFPSSVLVERLGYGHQSISQKSTCINKVIGDYFVYGTVPTKGTVCDVDAGPFDQGLGPIQPRDVLTEAEQEEQKIADAMASIGRYVARANSRYVF